MEILERRPYAYRTSFPLDEARVRLAGGEEAVVLLKELDRSALDRRTRAAKPDFVHDPTRELVVYEQILAPHDLGTAECYGTIDGALALEKVEGSQLSELGALEGWERAARSAARLHATVPCPSSPSLLPYDAVYFRRWLERARRFRPGPEIEALVPAHERAVTRLGRLPRVFVHGEFYPSNIVVASGRVCPVDWEMAGVAPGVLDLAALATGREPAVVDRLVAVYGEEAGARPTNADIDAARVVLAVQWLGWSKSWTPPRQHATDWLAEAATAADGIGS
jgi:hypothetical protein